MKSVLLSFLLAFVAMASSANAKVQYSELRTLIEKNDIRSIEELLPLMPADLKTHYNLIHSGKGAQDSSLENPRVVLFGNDARSNFAFNGSEKQKGFYDFEFSIYNESKNMFEYGFVRFNKDRRPPTFSALNPPRCLSCHGTNPRPIFAEYSRFISWPEYYLGAPRLPNQPDVRSFLSSMDNHPRYRHLNKERFLVKLPENYSPETYDTIFPTDLFGMLIGRVNALRIGGQYLKSDVFKRLRYSYLLFNGLYNGSHLLEHDCWRGSGSGTQHEPLHNELHRYFDRYTQLMVSLAENRHSGRWWAHSLIGKIATTAKPPSTTYRGISNLLPVLVFAHEDTLIEHLISQQDLENQGLPSQGFQAAEDRLMGELIGMIILQDELKKNQSPLKGVIEELDYMPGTYRHYAEPRVNGVYTQWAEKMGLAIFPHTTLVRRSQAGTFPPYCKALLDLAKDEIHQMENQ